MATWISLAVGGAVGAITRYRVFDIAQRYVSGFFPWGTLAINSFGSFAIGFLWGVIDRFPIATPVKTFLVVGFLGSFTTFSDYTLQTMQLFRVGEFRLALSNVFVHNFIGLVLVFAGFASSRYLLNLFRMVSS